MNMKTHSRDNENHYGLGSVIEYILTNGLSLKLGI